MAKGDNLTQVQSALDPTDVQWLNDQNPGMGQRINATLTHLGNVLGAAAGHRGTVVLKKQKGKDVKGTVDASLDASEGRLENVADPVKDLDAVNLRTARRLVFREEQDREEQDDAIQSLPTAAGIGVVTAFVPHEHPGIVALSNNGATAMSPITAGPTHHACFSWFNFPYKMTVNYMSFQNKSSASFTPSPGGIGIYTIDGNLIGGFSNQLTTPGDVVNTLTVAPFDLEPGEYYLGQTGWASSTSVTMSVLQVGVPPTLNGGLDLVLRVQRIRIGSVITDPAVLPPSFDPAALDTTIRANPVFCLLHETV